MTPPFLPGQPVARRAFTDCFNRPHERVNDLTVESVRLVECQSIPNYYRVTASRGDVRVEAAARFFEPG